MQSLDNLSINAKLSIAARELDGLIQPNPGTFEDDVTAVAMIRHILLECDDVVRFLSGRDTTAFQRIPQVVQRLEQLLSEGAEKNYTLRQVRPESSNAELLNREPEVPIADPENALPMTELFPCRDEICTALLEDLRWLKLLASTETKWDLVSNHAVRTLAPITDAVVEELDIASEIKSLERDFGRLFLADVKVQLITERKLNWRSSPKTGGGLRNSHADDLHPGRFSFQQGLRVGDITPKTIEEWNRCRVWYDVSGTPIVNSVGDSLILEPGWSTIHSLYISGTHSEQTEALIERASHWAAQRFRQIAPLLWPRHCIEEYGRTAVWLDVVDRVAELANLADLPSPEWFVYIGERTRMSTEAWHRRDEIFPRPAKPYSEADLERIGEIPEVVYATRDNILGDSERALRWLLTRLEPAISRPAPRAEIVDRNPIQNEQSIIAAALKAVVDGRMSGVLAQADKLSAKERANAVMLEMLASDSSYYEWTLNDWVEHLRRAKKTIQATEAWQKIMAYGEANREARKVSKKTL